MKIARNLSILEKTAYFFWAATLLTLPVTSFRFFPAGEGTYVRPLAFYPLVLLLLTKCMQVLRGRTTLPRVRAFTPLMALMLVIAVTSAIGIFLAPIPMREQDAMGRILRGWIAVLVGISFFLGAVWMNNDESDLRFSVKWLLSGFALDILWSCLQAATFYFHILPKPLVTQWQRAFSLRELIRINRISGLAYEPSWLAGQISTLYLPWLFAAVLTGERAMQPRWLEPCMLVLAFLLLIATFSRGGLLIAGVTVVVTFLLVGRATIGVAWHWFTAGLLRGRELVLRASMVLVAIAAIAGSLILLGQKNYIARIWTTQASSLEEFIIQNSAGARAAYIWGAMSTYQAHPWTGVGLGASGLYLYSKIPDWALTTVPEIARQLSPESTLYPNPKNLYVRLLAETGLLGFFLFIGFQFSLLGEVLSVWMKRSNIWKYLSAASFFTWFALVLYNMTQDSFAMPNLWINLGMLAGLSRITEHRS